MTDQQTQITQASERLPQQSLASSASMTTARCEPATKSQGVSELGACLTLVSPSGLTADDRKEWLAVAMQTLSGIPADLLRDGCAEARKRCRFPSEIVPTIMEAVEKRWQWRKDAATRPPPQPPVALIETDIDERPLTVDELLGMTPDLLRIARRNGFADPETFAEFDRIMDERRAA